MNTFDVFSFFLRVLLLFPLFWFLWFQHNNRKLNGRFHLVRKFTCSVAWAFIVQVVAYLFARILYVFCDIPLDNTWVFYMIATSHVISIGLLFYAALVLKDLRNEANQ